MTLKIMTPELNETFISKDTCTFLLDLARKLTKYLAIMAIIAGNIYD